MDKRIGAQLYTVRDFCKTAEDISSTFEKIAKIGYKTVQVSGFNFDVPASEVKAAADKNGLQIVCTHLPYAKFTEDIDWVINYQNTIDCPVAGLGSMPKEFCSPEGLKKFFALANDISSKLKKHGIKFGYHNHAFEFMKFDGKYLMDIMAEETDPDSFCFILDVYWLAVAGINPAEYIKKIGSRAEILHYKDLKATIDWKTTMCEVMEGNLKWDEIIAASEEAGCKFAVVEQDTCEGDPFEALETSYKNLITKGFN